MAAPANILHQGQIPIEIDHAYAPIVTAFSRRKVTPTQVKKSASAVSKTFGIPDVSGSMTVFVPAAGLGFSIDALNARPEGFTISFPWAGEKFLILGCNFAEDDRSVTPSSGDSTMTLSFTGTGEINL